MDLEAALDSAGIVDEAQFPEPVHEEADSRAGGSHHFGQSFLADLWDDRLRNTLLAEMSQQ